MTAKKPTTKRKRGAEATVPDGAPDWVTEELILETLDTWQPYYGGSLTAEDALEILLGVTKLFEFIHEM